LHLIARIDHCFHDEGPADCEETLSLASFSNSIHRSVCLYDQTNEEKLTKPNHKRHKHHSRPREPSEMERCAGRVVRF
jgi:hypothetical protein